MEVEREFHLRAICHLEMRERVLGAYLLQEGKRYCLRFGFVTPGIHPFIGEGKREKTLQAWSEGLIGLPPGEVFRIHQRSYPQNEPRLRELEARAESIDSAPLQVLTYTEQRHVEELTLKGQRSLYNTHLFASYTHQPGTTAQQELLEKFFARVLNPICDAYQTIKGVRTQEEKDLLAEIIINGFEGVFLKTEQQLNSRMGLKAMPMQHQDLMDYAWSEFNLSKSKPTSHLIVAKEVEGKLQIEEQITSKLSLKSFLVRGANGRPSVPIPNLEYFKIKDQYIAAMVLEQKLDGYADLQHQFEFFWRPLLKVHHCEVVWECQHSSSTWESINLQRSLSSRKNRRSLKP